MFFYMLLLTLIWLQVFVNMKIFHLRTDTSKKKISMFAHHMVRIVPNKLFTNIEEFLSDEIRRKRSEGFEHAKYTVDVLFQKANRALGSLEKVRSWFSKSHASYVYKTKASVLASGVAFIYHSTSSRKNSRH